jgi:hypothetical protein
MILIGTTAASDIAERQNISHSLPQPLINSRESHSIAGEATKPCLAGRKIGKALKRLLVSSAKRKSDCCY